MVDESVKEQINAVVRGDKPWPIFLTGGAGSGKTCAALCVLDWASGRYTTTGELCELTIEAQQGRLTWSSGYERTTFEVWRDWREARLAVLDELGARGKVSDHHYEVVKKAVDAREGRSAIFVSNHGLAEIERLYDDRIASRLAGGTVVEMSGDRRLA